MSNTIYTSAMQGRWRRLLPDLYAHKGLLRDMVSKELRARYRNAMMGFLWAILHPLLMTLILSFIFMIVFPGGMGVRPAMSAAFILCGLIFWQFFAGSLTSCAYSLLADQELIKKVYFPRELAPLSSLANHVVNLAIGLLVLLVLLLGMEGIPGFHILWLPVVFSVELGLCVGLGLLLAALNVHYRDVGHMLEVAIFILFYSSPIFYQVSWVEERLGAGSWAMMLYKANPMCGLLTAYRQALFGAASPEGARSMLTELLPWPALCALAALAVGSYVFRRMSPTFADHL